MRVAHAALIAHQSRHEQTRFVALTKFAQELNGRKFIARTRQRLARDAAVILHLRNKRVVRIELPLLANPIDEGDVDVLAVEVAGKIEQKNLEQNRAGVEHRPPPEPCHAAITTLAGGDAHRIDAVAQPASRVELEIGGRNTELAAGRVAVDHFTGYE